MNDRFGHFECDVITKWHKNNVQSEIDKRISVSSMGKCPNSKVDHQRGILLATRFGNELNPNRTTQKSDFPSSRLR